MKQFIPLFAVFSLFCLISNAQITPRSGGGQPSTTTSTNGTASTPVASALEAKSVNGLNLQLRRVIGNAADQTVALEIMLTNPKGNTRVILRSAEAIDFDGDIYKDKNGGYDSFDEILRTDVPRRVSMATVKIPAKVKSLALFKFVIWNELTGKSEDVEFRKLNIEW